MPRKTMKSQNKAIFMNLALELTAWRPFLIISSIQALQIQAARLLRPYRE
jgi:hypothetical protein